MCTVGVSTKIQNGKCKWGRSDEGYFYKGHSVTARVKTLAFSTFQIFFPELFEHFLIIALQYVELKLDAVAGINENQFNRKA